MSESGLFFQLILVDKLDFLVGGAFFFLSASDAADALVLALLTS